MKQEIILQREVKDLINKVVVKEEILLPNVTIKQEKDGEAILWESGEITTNCLPQIEDLECIAEVKNLILESADLPCVGEKLEPGEVHLPCDSKKLEPGENHLPCDRKILEPGEVPPELLNVKAEDCQFTQERRQIETKDCYVDLHRGWERNEIAKCKKCRSKGINLDLSNKQVRRSERILRNGKVLHSHDEIVHEEDIFPPLEKQFECDICKKKFFTKDILENHIRFHLKLKPLKCKIIKIHNKNFDKSGNSRHHSRVYEKRFECDVCGKKFSQEINSIMHARTHKIKSKTYECNECHEIFHDKKKIAKHIPECLEAKFLKSKVSTRGLKRVLRGHFVGEENDKEIFGCNLCDFTAYQQCYIEKHVRRVHLKDKQYECEKCAKKFFTKELLENHMRVHTKEKPFKCKICNARFLEKKSVKRHMPVHTGERQFKCNVCSKTFSRQDTLKRHAKTHTNKKPFECKLCRVRFRMLIELTSHGRIHEGKPFQCDLCKKGFKDKKELKKHFRTYKVEYKCKLCESRYHKKSSYQHHLYYYCKYRDDKDEIFRCDWCRKSFKKKAELIRHFRINKVDYKCGKCEKRYHKKSTYQSHLNSCLHL